MFGGEKKVGLWAAPLTRSPTGTRISLGKGSDTLISIVMSIRITASKQQVSRPTSPSQWSRCAPTAHIHGWPLRDRVARTLHKRARATPIAKPLPDFEVRPLRPAAVGSGVTVQPHLRGAEAWRRTLPPSGVPVGNSRGATCVTHRRIASGSFPCGSGDASVQVRSWEGDLPLLVAQMPIRSAACMYLGRLYALLHCW